MSGYEMEIEAAKLEIMSDVRDRFDEVIKELDEKGTEFSRRLADEIRHEKESVTKQLEDLWSYSKSKLVSIEAGQKTFYDGILPRLLDKVDIAVKMARDSTEATARALNTARGSEKNAKRAEDAACRAESAVRSGNWQVAGIIVAISLAIITDGAKLWQDWQNQKETSQYLQALSKGVKVVETLEERAKALDGHQPSEDKPKERK